MDAPDNLAEAARVLTEEDAAHAFAKAWNRLDPEGFLVLLAEDARYASQWVFEELVGAPAIGDYLRKKMQTVKMHSTQNPAAAVSVEIGRTTASVGARPCALMTQGIGTEIQAAVLFTVERNRVSRYDLCMPQLVSAVRTGVFPR
jgi:hypothetical protein